MKQMAGRGRTRRILAQTLYYTSSGILLFQIWHKLGRELGETEAKSSNALLATYFSCNKISNKTKQAVVLEQTVRLGPPALYISHFRNITCNHMLELKGNLGGKYDIFSLESAQK